jgi:hypothetical protein
LATAYDCAGIARKIVQAKTSIKRRRLIKKLKRRVMALLKRQSEGGGFFRSGIIHASQKYATMGPFSVIVKGWW